MSLVIGEEELKTETSEMTSIRGWAKIQLHRTTTRARSVRSIGAVKPLNGRKRLFDPPNHVIWPDLQLRIVSNRRDFYGAIKIW